MMTEQHTYTIEYVSQTTGLTVYTLRYYEEIGLLDLAFGRPAGAKHVQCAADRGNIKNLVSVTLKLDAGFGRRRSFD